MVFFTNFHSLYYVHNKLFFFCLKWIQQTADCKIIFELYLKQQHIACDSSVCSRFALPDRFVRLFVYGWMYVSAWASLVHLFFCFNSFSLHVLEFYLEFILVTRCANCSKVAVSFLNKVMGIRNVACLLPS